MYISFVTRDANSIHDFHAKPENKVFHHIFNQVQKEAITLLNRYTCELRGAMFEGIVGNYLSKHLDCYVRYDKSYYSYKLQKDTAIDVLAVTDRYVLVVEAKNWTDWIKGNYNDFHWQGHSRSHQVMTVVSPYWQNFNHIRTLKNSALREGVKLPPLVNLIVVPDTTIIESDCEHVCHLSEMIQTVNKFTSSMTAIYSKDEVIKSLSKLH